MKGIGSRMLTGSASKLWVQVTDKWTIYDSVLHRIYMACSSVGQSAGIVSNKPCVWARAGSHWRVLFTHITEQKYVARPGLKMGTLCLQAERALPTELPDCLRILNSPSTSHLHYTTSFLFCQDWTFRVLNFTHLRVVESRSICSKRGGHDTKL